MPTARSAAAKKAARTRKLRAARQEGGQNSETKVCQAGKPRKRESGERLPEKQSQPRNYGLLPQECKLSRLKCLRRGSTDFFPQVNFSFVTRKTDRGFVCHENLPFGGENLSA